MIAQSERLSLPAKEPLNRTSLIITVDGSSTAGKRLMAERIAERYNLTVLNTGTAIRAMALLAIEQKLVKTDDTNVTHVPVDFADRVVELYDTMPQKLTIAKPLSGGRMARIMVGERNMGGELFAFRQQKAIENVSAIIASSPVIRQRLYTLWRDAAKELGGVVIVGRRTGVDLFPNAPIKLYLFASPEASASYRVVHDPTATLHEISEERYIRERDGRDRENGLLDRPSDAMVFDTSAYILQGSQGLANLEKRITGTIDSKYIIR